MKTLYVNDLDKGLTISNETFALKEVQFSETKDKKPFYRVVLVDKTGEIGGQIWSDNIPNVEKNALKVGKVVNINAVVEDYRGKLQLNILKVNAVDENALDEYLESSDFDLDELWQRLLEYIDKVQNPQIKQLLQKTFANDNFNRKFKTSPAAEYVHHSFRGGLLEHVLEMLDLAMTMSKYYPEANFDLVVAGIIFHDIGKTSELDTVGTVVQRTPAGYLLGHITIGYEMLINLATGILDEDTLLQLKHIVLSHHGELEFGSPVLPASIEAAIVHGVDDASSKVRIYQKIMRKNTSKEGQFSDWDNILRTRVFLGKKAEAKE